VVDVSPQRVRRWHETAAKTTGPTVLAQSYRLLRALLNVAVEDGAIPTNPCRVASAANPKPATRAHALTVAEVRALAAAMPARYQALPVVLGFGGLRFGEATALRRRDVTPDGAVLTVERAQRLGVVGEPKTEAGRRTVALPGFVAVALAAHLAEHVPDDPDALEFGTRSGRFLSSANAGQMFKRAGARAGLSHFRIHWLRHSGATLAAATPGVSIADLQRRLGHSTPAAALAYQHAVNERDADIARALDALAH
jgi:integrase